jgi:hypothetical protein
VFFFNSENKKSKKINEDVQNQKSIIDSKIRLKRKSCLLGLGFRVTWVFPPKLGFFFWVLM